MPNKRHKSSIHRFLGILFLSSLTLCLWLGHLPLTTWEAGLGNRVTAQSLNASKLVQQGVDRYQAGEFQRAIEPWQNALKLYQQTNNRANEAIVLENLARAYQQLGQDEQAIHYWEQVTANYRQRENWQQVGRMLTELAQAYSRIGQPRKAIALLCNASQENSDCVSQTALQIVRTYQDRQGEAAALGSLGEAYLLTGKYDQAIARLEEGLNIAQEIDPPVYHTAILNSLGNAYTNLAQRSEYYTNSAQQRGASNQAEKFRQEASNHYQKALKYFQKSLELARTQNNRPGQIRALLNLIRLYDRPQNFRLADASNQAAQAVQQAQDLLKELPDSLDKVYAAIDLANLKQPVPDINPVVLEPQCPQRKLGSQAETLLNEAVLIAQRLQEPRSESFALGELGHFYECRQNYQKALDLTQKARWTADQNLLAKDSLYLWEWQAARIFKAQKQESKAIAAYERAIATLKELRGNLLIAERDLQFDFRDAINPLYREFAQLRLERASLVSIKPDERNKELDSALETVDSLKLAELQNYFGNDCILTAISEERVDELVGKDTAVFSSIILNDRTAILLTLPNGEKKLEWIDVDSETLKTEINEFRNGLEMKRRRIYDRKPAQKLYNWIVRPFDSDLDAAQVKTLVFIQDGILRSIPMAALHDGENFLVENYAIATTPSLTLIEPTTLKHQQLRVLALGLTQKATVNGQDFPALTNVKSELGEVETLFPGSKMLLDNDFTRNHLEKELSETVYPILHMATHAQFGTVSEDTFLVTGNNDKLTLKDLEQVIRTVSRGSNSVELLALTACQTAVGDDRAALGLAGVAIQAGVSSTLASLWSVPDASTKTLATEFYKNWHNLGMSKAEALSTAQRKLIKARELEEINDQYVHPAYWAPFILIGNWL